MKVVIFRNHGNQRSALIWPVIWPRRDKMSLPEQIHGTHLMENLITELTSISFNQISWMIRNPLTIVLLVHINLLHVTSYYLLLLLSLKWLRNEVTVGLCLRGVAMDSQWHGNKWFIHLPKSFYRFGGQRKSRTVEKGLLPPSKLISKLGVLQHDASWRWLGACGARWVLLKINGGMSLNRLWKGLCAPECFIKQSLKFYTAE